LPVFQYTARNEEGQLVRERLAFRDEIELRHHLRKNNMFVLDVAERRKSRTGFRRGVGLGDLIVMARQLRTMIMAGLPLVTGLEALGDQSPNPRMGEIMNEVARAVGTGRSLSATMRDYPDMFPEMMVTLIRAGEEGGRLPDSLKEASRQLELQMEIRQKLISALMYPVFTLLATFGTVAVMVIWIVPVFAKIYAELNAKLPPPTLFLVWLSDLVVHQAWIVLTIFAAVFIALRRYYKTPEGRMQIDALKLKIPLVGTLFLKGGSGNLTGSLAGLLDSGVPLIQAMQTSARVTGNAVLEKAIYTAATNISAGRRLSDELELSEQFPLMVVRMIAMAEETGNMPEVLRQISASYVEEVEYAIKRIMTIVEPILILTVGGIVGFVLVCLYYPIFNLGNVFLEGS